MCAEQLLGGMRVCVYALSMIYVYVYCVLSKIYVVCVFCIVYCVLCIVYCVLSMIYVVYCQDLCGYVYVYGLRSMCICIVYCLRSMLCLCGMCLCIVYCLRSMWYMYVDPKKPPPRGGFPIHYVSSSRTVCKRTPLEEPGTSPSRGVLLHTVLDQGT